MPETDVTFEAVRRLRTTSTLLLDAIERDDVDGLLRWSEAFDRGLAELEAHPPNSVHEDAIRDLRVVHDRILQGVSGLLTATSAEIGAARLAKARLARLRHAGPAIGETLTMDT
jgi:hypothetical protein